MTLGCKKVFQIIWVCMESRNSSFFKKVIRWSRYVDDLFGVFNRNLEELLDFQKYLNLLHPNIKFTLEIEKDNCINFLDLAIIKHNNKLHFNIYRKPTTTNQVIPFDSTAPITHKLASFRFFFNRLFNTPLQSKDYNQELNTNFHMQNVMVIHSN